MNKYTNNNIKLGTFVISSFIVFIIAIYYIGSKQNLFGSTFTLSAEFSNVNGLQKGNNVLYNGITIGSVSDIVIINDSLISVNMTIDQKVKKHIKKNSIASINTSGLVGNMIVNIRPGNGNSSFVENKDVLQTSKSKNTTEIIDDLGITAINLTALTNNLISITDKMNQGEGTVGLLLSDKQMAADIKSSIGELHQSSLALKSMMKSINGMVTSVEKGEGNLGYLIKDNTLKTQLNNISSDIDTLLKQDAKSIFSALSTSVNDINIISREIKDLSLSIKKDENLVNSLLLDSTLSRQLEQTIYNLEHGTRRFDESLEALQQSWLLKKLINKKNDN